MILLLDVGNSRIKSARWDGTRLLPFGAFEHHGDPAGALDALAELPADAVWLAHVMGGAHEGRLCERIAARYGAPPRIARVEKSRDGLTVAYAEPQRLGVDRWLAMLALWHELRGPSMGRVPSHSLRDSLRSPQSVPDALLRAPFCVAGAGTALTFDAVDARGSHQGGLIAPGLAAMQRELLSSTRFPAHPGEAPYGGGLGCDTESGVHQGALFAALGFIERAGREVPSEARFITGGDAAVLQPRLATGWILRPDLVLEGLAVLARVMPAGG